MSVRIVSLSAVLAALLGSAGQTAIPANGPFAGYGADPSGVQVMQRYADCLARERRATAQVMALLETQPGSPDEKVGIARLSEPARCISSAEPFTLPNSVIRGALAEAWYKSWYPKLPFYEGRAQWNLPEHEDPTLAALAACVVETDVRLADTLVRTKPGTWRDTAAMRDLRRTIAACDADERAQGYTHVAVRAALAEALLVRARTIRPTAWERR